MLETFKIELSKFIKKHEINLIEIFTNSWDQIKTDHEIPQLKYFLLNENGGIHYINEKISQLQDESISIKFNAVYSHGSPKVTFDFNETPASRELADLLVILRINEHNPTCSNTLYSRSFLSQWKLNQEDNKNIEQEFLYDSAPSFNMPIWITGRTEAERKRNFENRLDSLNFFYLNNRTFIKRPAGAVNIEFPKLLIDLLNLDYGLEFNKSIWIDELEKPSSWDKLMNDLINKVGRERKIKGYEQAKLIEYKISNAPYIYHINNEEVVEDLYPENRFQSMLIIDINFNRLLKIKQYLAYS